jgi:hypothetical protein
MQKLLPVLTTMSNLLGTFWKASANAFNSFGMNSLVGVLASLGFWRKSTVPNLLSLSKLNLSPLGTRKCRFALP